MRSKIWSLMLLVFASLSSKCQIDSSEFSFYRVYTKIFAISCALPACHDGSFEPDLRTPESAYYTLVYHPVRKNNLNKAFKYRVDPKDPSASVLYQRISNCCFVNTNDRMPLTILAKGDTLSREEIDLIKNWIEGGAKDISGCDPEIIIAPISVEPSYTVFVKDSMCISAQNKCLHELVYKPFVVSAKCPLMRLGFTVSTSDSTRLKLLSGAMIRISDSIDNFSNAKSIKLKFRADTLETQLRPSDFKSGRVYYIQIELRDEKANKLVKYPKEDAEYTAKLRWSFSIVN